MPCRKQSKNTDKPKHPPPYVLTLYDFDPDTFEDVQEGQPDYVLPDVSSQLAFQRGEKLIVASAELDWWIYCTSMRSQKEGYVPTVLLAPLCEEFDDESTFTNDSKQRKYGKLVSCVARNCVDLKYFPNAPETAAVHQLRKPCPEDDANIFSRMTFWWMTGLIIGGYKTALQDRNLWSLPHRNEVGVLVEKLLKEWNEEQAKSRESASFKRQFKAVSKDSGIEEKENLMSEAATTDQNMSMKENDLAQNDSPHVQMRGRRQKQSKQPSFVKALIRAFGFTFMIGSVLKFFFDALIFASPYLLRLIISYAEGKGPQETWRGYLYAVLLLVVAVTQSLILHQYFHRAFVTGMRARSSVLGLIYRKMLVLNNRARRQFTVGEMVNLMSVDTTKLQDITTYLNMIWSAPFQILVALYFLYNTMGWSIFAGVGVMLLLMPINLYVTKKAKILQTAQMKIKDERSKVMNEILSGIKVLKLYAWEDSFIEKVLSFREQELKELKSMKFLNAGFSFTWSCAPFLVSVATFAVYVLSGNDLTASKAFVAISLFNILRFPMSMLPTLISSMVQCRVSIKRISEFLQAEELDRDSVVYTSDNSDPDAIKIENGIFTWEDPKAPTLSDIDLTVERKRLVAIVGTVGSGKSSLLSALLGEMEKLKGNVSIKGSVAYVPQQAWIQNATLKDNILFGRGYSAKRYGKVLDACALRADLEVLPGGDMTEIGERGINLSGGQKQRVSIARATYANADIYLFDDPLSAVDAHVGRHIFDEVIGPNGILKNKVRILVTHGLSYLSEVDQVVVLQNGTITEMGSYQELLDKGNSFSDFLRAYLNEAEDDLAELDQANSSSKESLVQKIARRLSQESFATDANEGSNEKVPVTYMRLESTAASIGDRFRTFSESSTHEDGEIEELLHKHTVMDTLNVAKEKTAMIKAETSETGRVKVSVFWTYASAVGIFISIVVVVGNIIAEGFVVASRIWLAEWSSADTKAREKIDLYLGVYGALGLGQLVSVYIFSYCIAYGAYTASRALHHSLLVNIMHCPMSFFDTTPMGRIVNRFSSDINKVDEAIPHSIRSFLATFFSVCSTVFVISYSTPMFLAVLLPLSAVYIVTQRIYVATSRQLKRLESVKRSPIYNHFFESINGASTIRAYRDQTRFIQDSEYKVDENQTAYYPNISSNRWLAVRLEFVGNCIVFFAALFAVTQKDNISPGLIGLSITYALGVTQTLNWMVRMTSELETNIVSVERVKEYAEVPGEASWILKDDRPPSEWPVLGTVAFKEYGVRYRPGLDLVLKDVHCAINDGEKVGIVGRTGAGKSSIALALFRIIEAAEGSITIDDVNIASIGLHDLRSKLTIIPQDPVLFSGSVRFNLDPFKKYTDDELWYALEVAHLKHFVSELQLKLEHEISEGGENLSVGQRQLVCLARALLRKTKVLVLDEATAAVDMETDEFIQQTIRKEFKECTILTIAHRLNTIMDYDRIMVLDKGKIVEFASPTELLGNKESRFYGMAKDSGLV